MADHLGGGEAARQHRPDPEKEWISAGEHADGLPPPGLDRVERILDRRRPDERLGLKRLSQREMASAADDKGRLRDEAPRGRREAAEPVLA